MQTDEFRQSDLFLRVARYLRVLLEALSSLSRGAALKSVGLNIWGYFVFLTTIAREYSTCAIIITVVLLILDCTVCSVAPHSPHTKFSTKK